MNRKKKIAVFTSTRAEYGSLNFLLKELYKDNTFELELLVGGSHLLEEFGNTIDEILNDGYVIHRKFHFLCSDSEEDNIARSMANLTNQIGKYYIESAPDLILLLGDRFELLPVAIVSLVMNIPIAHVSGGEITEGAIDNQVRNALSKIACLHFVATEDAKFNLIALGENSERICVAGELGLDELGEMELLSQDLIFNELGLEFDKKVILATFHPETINGGITPEFLRELYTRILEKYPEIQILTTASNFDKGGEEINNLLKKLSLELNRFYYVENLGKKRYYSILKFTRIVLGNSSSGIYEIQSFNIPTIDVGERQKGRLSNPNTLHLMVDIDAILDAMDYCQTSEFSSTFLGKPNVYGGGNTTKKIISFLKNTEWTKLLTEKKDVNFSSINHYD
jgi:UDP-hydrolysing UDP-N-acetyl-D-glucosamine 2-epimerase